MRHVQYILIDEMIFVGPTLFVQVDSCLHEAFPKNKDCPFGGRSIILVGDLAQLPPIKDKSLYAGQTTGKFLWESFNNVVGLDKIFRHEGDDPRKAYFRNILTNIRNAKAFLSDWDLLMMHVDSFLYR